MFDFEKNKRTIPIIYEDNHILIIEKPVNMPTQEDKSRDLDLLNHLKMDLKLRYQKPGNVFLGLVHRLDRPVGGVMVFAKTSKAASRLSELVRTRKLKKTYLAVVHGKTPSSQTWTDYLIKDTRINTVYVVEESASEGKKAILHFKTIQTSDQFSLVQIKLETGRPHQIRVQFASRGFPLYGDQKYGSEKNQPGQQLALWSTELSFIHPTLKEEMTFQSLPPATDPWISWNQPLKVSDFT